jgi:predicted metal-binding membrane protein
MDFARAPAGSPAPATHRRERAAILAAIAGATALAWGWLASMAGMPMGGMRVWSAADFSMMFAMWAVMMVGMMLPGATPMTLVYAQVARKAAREGSVLPPVAVFVAGYLLAWTGFSLVATAAQWALDRAALLSPMLVAESPRLGAALLVAAGLYQLTPWKGACLRHCRAPAHFFAEHFRPGRLGALRLGLHHGLYCLGCCWALMGLLFVGGVMNLVWIAAIAIFVMAEKLIPHGVGGGRLAGAALIALGALLLARG